LQSAMALTTFAVTVPVLGIAFQPWRELEPHASNSARATSLGLREGTEADAQLAVAGSSARHIVANGELYDFERIQRGFERAGHHLRRGSD
jgi:hypothetical protein